MDEFLASGFESGSESELEGAAEAAAEERRARGAAWNRERRGARTSPGPAGRYAGLQKVFLQNGQLSWAGAAG